VFLVKRVLLSSCRGGTKRFIASSRCTLDCKDLLFCGHKCKEGCGKPHTAFCTEPCTRTCMHGNRCPKGCMDKCTPCHEPCKWQCSHTLRILDGSKNVCGNPQKNPADPEKIHRIPKKSTGSRKNPPDPENWPYKELQSSVREEKNSMRKLRCWRIAVQTPKCAKLTPNFDDFEFCRKPTAKTRPNFCFGYCFGQKSKQQFFGPSKLRILLETTQLYFGSFDDF